MVLVVGLVEGQAGILSTLSGRRTIRSDNFKSGAGGGTGRGSSWYSFHIVWQKDNEIRQLQKPSDDLVNHDTAT